MPAAKEQGLLMLLALAVAQPTMQEEDPTTRCSEPCACRKRLSDRLGLYAEQFKEAVLQQKRNELAAAKYALASSAGASQLRKALIPVIAASSEIGAACSAAIAGAAAAELAAQFAGGEVAGIYTGINALTKITGSFKAAAAGSNNLAAAQPTSATLGSTSQLACDGNNKGNYKAPTLATEEKEAPPGRLTLHSKLTAKCSAAASSSCHNAQLGDGGYIEVKLTYETTQPQVSSTWTTASHSADHVLSTTKLDLMGNNATELNNKLRALRDQHNLSPCAKDVTAYEALSNTGTWQLYATKALLNLHGAEKVAEPAALTAAQTAAYGANGKDFKAKLWDKVQETLVPVKENDQETLKTISTLSTTADVYKALARVLLKQQKKEQEDQQKVSKKVDTTKESECNSKKGTECAGECELVEGVCKPAKKGEGENKEKDGKAASTCAGKDEKKCGTTQGCKWENNACKDSSILLNKKFALSVVSAAFMPLLF